jgi:hypothetical protein
MTMCKPGLPGVAALLLAALGAMNLAAAQAAQVTPEEARAIAEDAYVYGYPLVTMEMTRRVLTNTAAPEGVRAPMGQFALLREYPTATDRQVTAPNADTLYSMAYLDLTKEPYVFGIPDTGDRYYLMPMLDGWTEVFQVPGQRTTGNRAQTYAITGPGWTGTLPAGLTEYKSPTNLVWILGRIYCTGTPEDYAAVHALQDELTLVPLSAYGKPYTPQPGQVDPSIDMRTPPRDQVNRMDTATYFKVLASLMKDNPPAAADASMVARMAKIGLVPGQDFDMNGMAKATADALRDVPKTGVEKIVGHFKQAGTAENGWVFSLDTGQYGTDYLQRATITYFGLGANRPEDAVYPTSEVDGNGQPYDGAKATYVMRFPAGQTPPVNGFWSLTMYDAEYFFYDNPLNRYTVSPRNDLKYNVDGSLDLYIQHESPGAEREGNWLPAPADRFVLMLRMYWPKEAILNGSWKVPPVEPAR